MEGAGRERFDPGAFGPVNGPGVGRRWDEEGPHRIQLEIYAKMTPAQKYEIAMNLYWQARQIKAVWVRQMHPGWNEEEVEAEVRRIFLRART